MNRRLHDIAPILSIILLILVLTWSGVHTLAVKVRESEIERSYSLSHKYAVQFAEQVARTVDSVQSTIDFAAYQISRSGSGYELKVMSDSGLLAAKPIVQVALVDPKGFTVATNAGWDRARTDLRDREHIRVHLDGKGDELYIGAPVLGRVSGKWSIQFTRKIFDREGSFIGIVVASVDPFYFNRFWKDTLGTDPLITLIRSDGAILTRSTALDWILTTGVRRPDITNNFGSQKEGRFTSESTEGGTRIGYFAKVNGLPLFVIAGAKEKEVAASYEAMQYKYHQIGIAITIIVLSLGFWLISISSRLRREEEAARHAEETKSAFLAAMSHELRTPLNALIGFVGLLGKTKLNEEQISYVVTMQRSAQMLRSIVTDVLDFSKLESGSLLIATEPTNIHELLKDLEKVTIILVGDKPVHVRMTRTSDVPEYATLDGARLYQALLNLCGNAAKFTQSGQIIINATVRKENGNDLLVASVTDSGPGIDDGVMQKLFTPFEQGEVKGTLRAAGTGLGLAISRMLLGLMGGTIRVESTAGLGSTFTVFLPIQRFFGTFDRRNVVRSGEVTKPLRILIADDARSSRLFLRILLEKMGHTVLEAEDGHQALEMIRKWDLDVVFLDIQMPHLGGLAVAKKVAQYTAQEGSPLMVALSAMARPEDISAAREAGISTYLTKPIHEEQIDTIVHLACQRIRTEADETAEIS